MIRTFFTNATGILTSRILGFLRDVMMANSLGASIYSDVFFLAFKIPNLFRRIFGEGSFTQTFIPFYASCKQKVVFASTLLYSLMGVIFAITLVVTFFPSIITNTFALGFSEELRVLSEPFVIINFYYLDMIFIVIVLTALLQYKNHFATSAFSTALLNVSLIGALLLSIDRTPIEIVWHLSIGVIIGGALQVASHLIALYRLNLSSRLCSPFKLKSKFHLIKKEVQSFQKAFWYSTLGNSTAHISAFLDTLLASFLVAGSISYLYYANRLFQLPMALFSIALSVGLFPLITKLIARKKNYSAFKQLRKAFHFLLFMLSFALIFGWVLAEEIVIILFQRGEFSQADTLTTSHILRGYLAGLLAFGLAKIFSTWLYAHKQHKYVAKVSAYSLGINIIMSMALIIPFQAVGLALASSIGGIIMLIGNAKALGTKKLKALTLTKLTIIWVGFLPLSYGISWGIKLVVRPWL